MQSAIVNPLLLLNISASLILDLTYATYQIISNATHVTVVKAPIIFMLDIPPMKSAVINVESAIGKINAVTNNKIAHFPDIPTAWK